MNKMISLFVVLVVFTSLPVEAGLFRKGPILPWRHQQWKEPNSPNPSNPSPVQPIIPVPPIIDPSIAIADMQESADLFNKDAFNELREEFRKFGVEVSSDSDSTKFPPWLPLGTAAGGGLLTLLAFARRGISLIKDA